MIKRFVLRDLSKLKIPFIAAAILSTAIGFVFFFLAQFTVFNDVKTPMLVMEITSRVTLAFVFVTTVVYLASKILRKNYITDLSSMDKIKLAFVRVAEAAAICFAFCSMLLVETTAVDAVVLDKYGVARELADASFLCFSAVGKGAVYWLLPFTTTVLVVFVVCAVYALKGLTNAMGNTVAGVVVWLLYLAVIVALLVSFDAVSRMTGFLCYTQKDVYTGSMPLNTFFAWAVELTYGIGVSQFSSSSFLLFDLTNVLLVVALLLSAGLFFFVYLFTQKGFKLRTVIPAAVMLLVFVLYPCVGYAVAIGNGNVDIHEAKANKVVALREGEAYDFSAYIDAVCENYSYYVIEDELKILIPGAEANGGTVGVAKEADSSDAYVTGNRFVAKKAGVYEFYADLKVDYKTEQTLYNVSGISLKAIVLPEDYTGYKPASSLTDFSDNKKSYILASDIEIDCAALESGQKGVLFGGGDFYGTIVNPYGYKITLKNVTEPLPLVSNVGTTGLLYGLIVDGAQYTEKTGAICTENEGTVIDCTVFGQTTATVNYVASTVNSGLIQGCKGFYRNVSGGMVCVSGSVASGIYYDTEIGNTLMEIGGL